VPRRGDIISSPVKEHPAHRWKFRINSEPDEHGTCSLVVLESPHPNMIGQITPLTYESRRYYELVQNGVELMMGCL
jgi:hypothetical protein